MSAHYLVASCSDPRIVGFLEYFTFNHHCAQSLVIWIGMFYSSLGVVTASSSTNTSPSSRSTTPYILSSHRTNPHNTNHLILWLGSFPGINNTAAMGLFTVTFDEHNPNSEKRRDGGRPSLAALDYSPLPRVTGRSFALCVLVSMGGLIFGYDTGQISGFLEMPDFLDR